MPTEADRLLVELALKNHLIKDSEAQDVLREITPDRDASAVLLQKGLVQQRHIDSLKKKVAKQLEERKNIQVDATKVERPAQDQDQTRAGELSGQASSSSGSAASDVTAITHGSQGTPHSLDPALAGVILFGQIAIQKRLIADEDLQAALVRQAELEKMGVRRRVGEILMDRKKLTPEIVQKILLYQEKFIFGCPKCMARWNVYGSNAQSGLKCPTCQVVLQPASSIQSIGVQGTLNKLPPQSTPLGLPRSNLVQSSSASIQASSERRPPTDQDPAGLLGLTWKGYKIEKVLGRGGMGAVYLATQMSLNRKVALKVMLRGAAAKPEELQRFVREARKALAKLSHIPNILQVWDAELEANGELAWFTMEFVKGRSFKEALQSGKFAMDRGARVVAKVARAMDHAHKAGIIHRDLKPQNIMLDEDDEPKVLDFGLAKTIDQNTVSQLTQMGAFLGTPSYMAPEQAGGDPTAIDGRADVYACGAMLYEVLTGVPPFRGANPVQTIKKVLNEPPIPPTKVFPQTLAVLEPPCLKALDKDPAKRQQTALELAEQIDSALGPLGSTSSAKAPGGTTTKDQASSKGIFGRLFGG